MSSVEDVRKLLRDFVAPELRGINQRLDDIIAGMEKSFAGVEKSFAEVGRLAQERQPSSDRFTAERLQALEKLAMEWQNALLDRMEAMRRELTMAVDLALATAELKSWKAGNGRQSRFQDRRRPDSRKKATNEHTARSSSTRKPPGQPEGRPGDRARARAYSHCNG